MKALTLFPFQEKAVERAIELGYLFLIFDTGLGKTASAISILARQNIVNTLVVCPAAVRTSWQDELALWWPNHPSVLVITEGTQIKNADLNGIVITSYELVQKLPVKQWGALIIDESQYIGNQWRCKRGKFIADLCGNNRTALRLLLTATPVMRDPKTLWNQLHCLQPGRWGNFWQFVRRYANITTNSYTKWNIEGLRPEFALELERRFALVSARVTRAEVADLLPLCTVQRISVPASTWHPDMDTAALAAFLTGTKKQVVLELIQQSASSNSHIVVFTYYREAAHDLGKACEAAGFSATHTIFEVTGNETAQRRAGILEDAQCSSRAIVCATMHSCGEGVNYFKDYGVAIFGELYPVPGVIAQACGRLSRLTSKVGAQIYIPVVLGSMDEIIWGRVKKRLDHINKIIKPGGNETALLEAFKQEEESEEEIMRGLRDMAVVRDEETT